MAKWKSSQTILRSLITFQQLLLTHADTGWKAIVQNYVFEFQNKAYTFNSWSRNHFHKKTDWSCFTKEPLYVQIIVMKSSEFVVHHVYGFFLLQ